MNEINKALSEGKDWIEFKNSLYEKFKNGKLKLTFEGTLTTLLSIVYEK